jgi:hypothetical protein
MTTIKSSNHKQHKKRRKKQFLRIFLIVFFCCFYSFSIFAQQSDSALIEMTEEIQPIDTDTPQTEKPVKIHSPKRAAWMSAVLPGLGQGYNRKYWKIPIVYAGFAGTTVGIVLNFNQYKVYRDEYRYRLNNDGDKQNSDLQGYGDENINALKQNYQRNMEIFILVTAAWYLINILDAVVDAHLMSYDISDNLTMHIVPSVQFNYLPTSSYTSNQLPATANISFIFNLK